MTQSRCDGEYTTFLGDETGNRIRGETSLETLREDADDDIWLMPAIALQRSVEDTSTDGRDT